MLLFVCVLGFINGPRVVVDENCFWQVTNLLDFLILCGKEYK